MGQRLCKNPDPDGTAKKAEDEETLTEFTPRPIITRTDSTKYAKDTLNYDIFENITVDDHCKSRKGKHCKALERIVEILDFHYFTTMQSQDGGKKKKPRNDDDDDSDDEDGDDENDDDDDDQKVDQNDGGNVEEDGLSMDNFIAFCFEHYKKDSMMNDYHHFMQFHTDQESIDAMKQRLYFDECESARSCCAMKRHYRDRRSDRMYPERVGTNWCVDKIDSVHYTVYHLTEIGLRYSKKVERTLQTEHSVESQGVIGDDDIGGNDDGDDGDGGDRGRGSSVRGDKRKADRAEKERVRREVQRKRNRFRTDGLDGTKNPKFRMSVQRREKFEGNGFLHKNWMLQNVRICKLSTSRKVEHHGFAKWSTLNEQC